MSASKISHLSLITALAAVLVAVPAVAEAQGRGNGNGNKDRDRDRPELIRRGEDRRDADREWEDRDEARRGPPFCRNGRGHPVHGIRWCHDRGFGVGGDLYGTLGRGDRRDDDRRSGRYEGSSSYDRAHHEFHLRHDRQCRARAAERPLDLQWQIRVRSECKERHDDWHYRAGREHQ